MVAMNPVLLKPTGNACSGSSSTVVLQATCGPNIIVCPCFDAVKRALGELDRAYDTLVTKAGSPAEINLKDHDIVNMRVAKHLGALTLSGDIDCGGSLAALVGTLELLDPDEPDPSAWPSITATHRCSRRPSIFEKDANPSRRQPMSMTRIDEEDSVSLDDREQRPEADKASIAVVQVPKISNFTDSTACPRRRRRSVLCPPSPRLPAPMPSSCRAAEYDRRLVFPPRTRLTGLWHFISQGKPSSASAAYR